MEKFVKILSALLDALLVFPFVADVDNPVVQLSKLLLHILKSVGNVGLVCSTVYMLKL